MPTVGIQGPLAFSSIAELMNRLMLFLVPFAAVVLLVAFIWGGFDLLLSQGDPGKIKKRAYENYFFFNWLHADYFCFHNSQSHCLYCRLER
jgi:hypothetical protein